MTEPEPAPRSPSKWLWPTVIALLAVLLLIWLMSPSGDRDDPGVNDPIVTGDMSDPAMEEPLGPMDDGLLDDGLPNDGFPEGEITDPAAVPPPPG